MTNANRTLRDSAGVARAQHDVAVGNENSLRVGMWTSAQTRIPTFLQRTINVELDFDSRFIEDTETQRIFFPL